MVRRKRTPASDSDNGYEKVEGESPKKSPYARHGVIFIVGSSIAAMCALIIEMYARAAFASIFSFHDFVLASALIGMVILSIVFRLDQPTPAKMLGLMVPMLVLHSLLFAKIVTMMSVGHLITIKLMATLVLSVIPLVFLTPVLIKEYSPVLSVLLPVLIVMPSALVAAAAFIAIVAVCLLVGGVYYVGCGTLLASVEGVQHLSAVASHQLGLAEEAPEIENSFDATKQWFNGEHFVQDTLFSFIDG